MTRRRPLLIGLGLLSGCAALHHPMPGNHVLDSALGALLQDPRSPLLALSALALHDGAVVYHGAFGLRHAGGEGLGPLPVTRRTLYRVASISKLVVTLGAMRMLEQGLLSLDDDVSRWLGWRLRHPHFAGEAITLRRLLSHRSGLSDGGERYNFDARTRLQDVLQPGGALFADGLNWQPDAAPGGRFQYVNLNFGVIAQVMENAGGERFDRLMQRLVLQPLGMRGGFDAAALPPRDLADVATLYRRRRVAADGREVWDREGPWVVQTDDFRRTPPRHSDALSGYVIGRNGTLFGPQGRLRTGAADLGVLMRMLLDEGRHAGRPFLQPQTVALLGSEQWRADPAIDAGRIDREWARSWGMGVQRFTDHGGAGRGDRLIQGGGFVGWGHKAEAYGLMGVLALDPARRRGLLVLAAGPGIDPDTHRAHDSALVRWQEQALTLLARHTPDR